MYAKISRALILLGLFIIICTVPGFSDTNTTRQTDKPSILADSELTNKSQADEFPVTDLLHMLNTTDTRLPASHEIIQMISGSDNQSSSVNPREELLYILNGSAEINAGSEVMKRFHHQPYSRALSTNEKSWNRSGDATSGS